MLKVAPCTIVRSYGRASKFFRLDGLLLFCIIMGLRSAGSAIMVFEPNIMEKAPNIMLIEPNIMGKAPNIMVFKPNIMKKSTEYNGV